MVSLLESTFACKPVEREFNVQTFKNIDSRVKDSSCKDLGDERLISRFIGFCLMRDLKYVHLSWL